jgi:hypothetical protein
MDPLVHFFGSLNEDRTIPLQRDSRGITPRSTFRTRGSNQKPVDKSRGRSFERALLLTELVEVLSRYRPSTSSGNK